ncbi:MAG: DUF4625 domain-containing protein [Saprospiraceae bacterium]|nr:DUF4625 domain-containing protein [Saprospiraceae bacterium]
MKKYALRLLPLFTLALLGASCGNKAVDDAPPQIEFTFFDPAPRPDSICGGFENVVFHVESGGTLEFEARFTDNVELSQYKIDIHSNFDCHGHKSNTQDWAVLEVGDISGQEYTLRRTLQVPAYVTAGDYHFQIQALDKAGNDDPQAAVFAIKVRNQTDTVPPMLTITEPNPAAGTLSLRKGEEYIFSGTVSDNFSLWEGGNGKLEFFYRSNASGNSFRWGSPLVFTAEDDNYKSFSVTLRVPNTLIAGEYLISVWAYDGVNNAAKPVYFPAQIIN